MSGAIHIKEVAGRKTKKKRKTRRRAGSIKKKVNKSKQEYVTLTRKLRAHLAHLKKTKQIARERYLKIRKEIRAKSFKSLANMKERIAQADILKTKGVKKHVKKTTKKRQKKKK